MALTDTIANSLIGIIYSMPKDWQRSIRVQPGIEDEIRQLAVIAPTNSEDFLRFLLTSRQRLREALLASALPENLCKPVVDLLERRSAIREKKEKLVRERNLEQAEKCLGMQETLTQEINHSLAGSTFDISITNVTDAISRIGWPTNGK